MNHRHNRFCWPDACMNEGHVPIVWLLCWLMLVVTMAVGIAALPLLLT